MPELFPNHVHLWHVEPQRIVDPKIVDKLRTWLSDEETARLKRFVFARHQQTFLVSHALVRAVLSTYAATPPAQWVLRRTSMDVQKSTGAITACVSIYRIVIPWPSSLSPENKISVLMLRTVCDMQAASTSLNDTSQRQKSTISMH
ncbi:MAG: hypothetical protein R3C68_16870 [Myxococcota bacterium]